MVFDIFRNFSGKLWGFFENFRTAPCTPIRLCRRRVTSTQHVFLLHASSNSLSMHKFPYKTPKLHLLMHKNASKNSVFGPVISRCFLHYLYASSQTLEISIVWGILIFFHFSQCHPLRLSNALIAPPKMHQNAVFGAFVGGFMHEFPDFGSVLEWLQHVSGRLSHSKLRGLSRL